MATAPDDRANQREAEALAVAALLGASYNLPGILRAARVRPRPFRRIEATEALRARVARPYFELIRLWRAEHAALVQAYGALLPPPGSPLPAAATDAMQAAVEQASRRVQAELNRLAAQFPGAFADIARWHRTQWLSRIRSATRVDVSTFAAPGAGDDEVRAAATRSTQLLLSVHGDVASRTGATLLNSLMAFVPGALVAGQLGKNIDAAKRRGARIAVDQADKIVSGLNDLRRREAGVTEWIWRHLDPQPHPRPEHQARDGRVYSASNQPNDLPGMLPNCKCWQEPKLG